MSLVEFKSGPRVYNKYHNITPIGSVYIGRPSKWGNPFSVKKYGRDRAISLFKEKIANNKEYQDMVRRELRGKNLVCFCKPKPCHGDILLEIAND